MGGGLRCANVAVRIQFRTWWGSTAHASIFVPCSRSDIVCGSSCGLWCECHGGGHVQACACTWCGCDLSFGTNHTRPRCLDLRTARRRSTLPAPRKARVTRPLRPRGLVRSESAAGARMAPATGGRTATAGANCGRGNGLYCRDARSRGARRRRCRHLGRACGRAPAWRDALVARVVNGSRAGISMDSIVLMVYFFCSLHSVALLICDREHIERAAIVTMWRGRTCEEGRPARHLGDESPVRRPRLLPTTLARTTPSPLHSIGVLAPAGWHPAPPAWCVGISIGVGGSAAGTAGGAPPPSGLR